MAFLQPRCRFVFAALITVPLFFGAGSSAFAACLDEPGGAAALAAAKAQVAADCDCEGAASHGAYVRCATRVAKERATAGLLPPGCRGRVRRCAARSICGKPNFITCCVPSVGCQIVRN